MPCTPKIYRVSNPQMIAKKVDEVQTLLSQIYYLDENGNQQFWLKEIFGVCEPAQTDKTPYGWDGEYVSAQPNDKHNAIVFFADRGVYKFEGNGRRETTHELSIIGWLQEKRYDRQDRGVVMYALINAILDGVFRYNFGTFGTELQLKERAYQTTLQTNHNVFEGFNEHTFLSHYKSCIGFRIDFYASVDLDCPFVYQVQNPHC